MYLVLRFNRWDSLETNFGGIQLATKMFDESVGYCPVFDTLEELEEAYPDSTYLKISVDEERQKCSEEQV